LPVIADFMAEDADGNVIEKITSIENVIHEVVVSDEETNQRLINLQKQPPLLQIQNMKTYFPASKPIFGKITGWIKAVDDVSFEVYPGETLGLVGESGCGKTTLGKTIIRLIDPVSGKIIYKGKNLTELTHKEMIPWRRELQIIFQDPYSSLNPRMTIGNAIIEPMEVHGMYANHNQRKEKVFDLLEKVGLRADFYSRYPHEFSGGQRQRIVIARALALNPKFIICDESVSALDVSVQAQVLNLLIHLRKEFGFTYIFISHDLSIVKFMSDRIIVMNNGKIEEIGVADDIYNNPQKSYTRKLIEAIPKGQIDDIKARLMHLN
jgi:peptide/nickel transport system ATP-binding protein